MIKAQGDSSRMHTLYMSYLQCRGTWTECTLSVSVRKSHEIKQEQIWEWFTRTQLIEHLKSEELADDLIARHKDAESKLPAHLKGRNPDFPDREDLWLYKAFARVKDKKIKAQTAEAEGKAQADAVEEDIMDLMEKELEDIEMGGSMGPKIKKTVKLKTGKALWNQALAGAKRLLKECEGWAKMLSDAGVKSGLRKALLEDGQPAVDALQIAVDSGEAELKDVGEADAELFEARAKDLLLVVESCKKEESGSENVSAATRALAEMGGSSLKNSSRDLYRFVRLPALTYVDCITKKEPTSDETMTRKLCMYDPHELLDYLWATKKIYVPDDAIRKYWEHFRKLGVPWSLQHPAKGDELPISVTLRPVLLRAVWSLNLALQGRRPGNSRPLSMKFATCEMKGDWKWFVETFEVRQWYNCNRICHRCNAANTASKGPLFTDFGTAFRQIDTMAFINEVLPEQPSPLVLLHGFHVRWLRWCLMHNLNLGIFQVETAEALLLLAETACLHDPSLTMQGALKQSYKAFKTWCRAEKAALSAGEFLQQLEQLPNEPLETWKARARSGCRLADWQNRLENYGRYLTKEQAQDLHHRGYMFLHAHKQAAEDAAECGRLRFTILPKYHVASLKHIPCFATCFPMFAASRHSKSV
ncbi:unnamed protein product [Symbiodinium sp. CCMP2456]|nr:unnamed protein product [Symbiodinium sp. CCMP2456]